jgi:hypothetical protein
MTASLHEKAGLTRFLKDWYGRALTAEDTTSLNLDNLIGRPATVVIVHEKSQDGTKTFANIKLIMPHKVGEPLKPSGLWVRLEDRPPKDEQGQPQAPAKLDLTKVQVHVGKFKGAAISDLTESAVNGLAEVWIPKAMANKDITAEDKRLIAAVNARLEEIKANKEIPLDDIPF